MTICLDKSVTSKEMSLSFLRRTHPEKKRDCGFNEAFFFFTNRDIFPPINDLAFLSSLKKLKVAITGDF